MIPDFMAAEGLVVEYFEPLVMGGDSLGNLTAFLGSYSHQVLAVGGFDSLSLPFKANRSEVDDWLESGLMRHVEIRDQAQSWVFEGFVDLVRATIGTLTVTRGPALEIANRVSLVYSTIDTTMTPPLLGVRVQTAVANDADSQARFGVLEEVLSSGGVRPSEAEEIRDSYLAERKDPETSEEVAVPAGDQGPEIEIEVKGYFHLLKKFTYSSTTTGTQNLSAKLAAILTADPNGILGTAQIATNTIQVSAYEQDNRTAWELIKFLTAHGDASANRYLFGIYDKRIPIYAQAPADLAYVHRLGDPGERILTPAEAEVRPWEVRPGKWVQIPDFLPARGALASDLRSDPRNMFIEEVHYAAPKDLQLRGGKVSQLPQIMAQLGLAGVGG